MPIVCVSLRDTVGAGIVNSLARPGWPMGSVQTAALSVGVELIPIDVRDAGEIEHAVRASRDPRMAV
jgi:hypothetical protein